MKINSQEKVSYPVCLLYPTPHLAPDKQSMLYFKQMRRKKSSLPANEVVILKNNRIHFSLYKNYYFYLTMIDLAPTCGHNLLYERAGEKSFKVYDIFGREVLDVSNKIIIDGELTIDNAQLPSPGIYFYRLTIGNESQTRMMVYMN